MNEGGAVLDPEDLPGEGEVEIPTEEKVVAPLELGGRKLEPFSTRRQMSAQAMGNRLMSGRVTLETVRCTCDKDPACEICDGTGEAVAAYDGMFADVAVVMFLCSCPISTVLKALRKPDAVLSEAMDWAERENLSIGTAKFAEACRNYYTIFEELQGAQFEVVEDASGKPPKKKTGATPATGG